MQDFITERKIYLSPTKHINGNNEIEKLILDQFQTTRNHTNIATYPLSRNKKFLFFFLYEPVFKPFKTFQSLSILFSIPDQRNERYDISNPVSLSLSESISTELYVFLTVA
mmetsp:Transcript_58635/g.67565  ORF Transcript_58635/g.67565 Transcript_58635/m.67565 type:complete len:111 (-) Transcript_58635:137-469(-)